MSARVFCGLVGLWFAASLASADEEPPDAQARAVAALPNAGVVQLVLPPPKVIVGIAGGSGSAKAVAGSATGLQQVLADLKARTVGQEIRIDLAADVLFDFDQAVVRQEAAATLAKVAEVIRAYPGARVRVEGHTDSIGDEAYNVRLSERRAHAVVEWLTSRHGLPAAAFAVKGWGESKPVAGNTKADGSDNPSGRQKNRRVEIVVVPGP